MQQPEGTVQSADFFDSHNPAGLEAREKALLAALEDLESWLSTGLLIAILNVVVVV